MPPHISRHTGTWAVRCEDCDGAGWGYAGDPTCPDAAGCEYCVRGEIEADASDLHGYDFLYRGTVVSVCALGGDILATDADDNSYVIADIHALEPLEMAVVA